MSEETYWVHLVGLFVILYKWFPFRKVDNKSKKSKVIFILCRYINYKKHKFLRLLADWIIVKACIPTCWGFWVQNSQQTSLKRVVYAGILCRGFRSHRKVDPSSDVTPLTPMRFFRNCSHDLKYFWLFLKNWEWFFKMFEGELLVMFSLTFLHQILFWHSYCLQNIKIGRQLLAAVNIYELSKTKGLWRF